MHETHIRVSCYFHYKLYTWYCIPKPWYLLNSNGQDRIENKIPYRLDIAVSKCLISVSGKWSALYRARFLFRRANPSQIGLAYNEIAPRSISRLRHPISPSSQWQASLNENYLALSAQSTAVSRKNARQINLLKKATSRARRQSGRRWAVVVVLIRERDYACIILYSLPTSVACMSFGCTRSRASARYYCACKADVRRARVIFPPRNGPRRGNYVSPRAGEIYFYVFCHYLLVARAAERNFEYSGAPTWKYPRLLPLKRRWLLTELSVNEARKRVVLRRVFHLQLARYACSYLPWEKKENLFYIDTYERPVTALSYLAVAQSSCCSTREYTRTCVTRSARSTEQSPAAGESRDSGRYMYYRIIEYVKSYETRSRLCQQL